MKYIPMRGSFNDAQKEAIEFDGSLSALVRVVSGFYKDDPCLSSWVTENNIGIKPHPFDQKPVPSLYTVTVDNMGVGFTDGPLI